MNGEHPNTPASMSTEQQSSDEVSVKIRWQERCSYETVVKMPRADYERLSKMFEGDEKQANRAESEIFHKHDLNRIDAYDWDDLEVDTFYEMKS